MRSRNASMSTLANYKEKASKFQRAINLINVIMIIEGIFLINQGLDLFNFYHLGQVSQSCFQLHLTFASAQLLVPLLCLVPNLRLRAWSLPLHHGHLQHRGGQPAKQQRPQLQNSCRTHRRPLLRSILCSNLYDLLCCQAGGEHARKSNSGQRAEGRKTYSSIHHQ